MYMIQKKGSYNIKEYILLCISKLMVINKTIIIDKSHMLPCKYIP